MSGQITQAPRPAQPQAGNGQQATNMPAAEPATPKRKRTRSTPVARPAYVIVQMLGEDGQPMAFDKKRVKIIAVERSPEKVLEAVESGELSNVFYLRVVVPAGSRAGSPNKPKDAAAA
jgi:hypothetical protein